MPGRVARHTLVRLRWPMVDDGRGNVGRNEGAAPERKAMPGWALDAGTTVEDLVNRDGAEVAWTARGPFDVDVNPASDRIELELDGLVYEVDGGVRRQPGPTPLSSHTILLLARWEG